MMRSRFVLLTVFLILLGCGNGPRLRKALDDRSSGILAGATKVEVFRIDGRNDPPDPTVIKPGDPTVGGYAILSKGKEQTLEFASRLKDLLTDPRTYSDCNSRVLLARCRLPGLEGCGVHGHYHLFHMRQFLLRPSDGQASPGECEFQWIPEHQSTDPPSQGCISRR